MSLKDYFESSQDQSTVVDHQAEEPKPVLADNSAVSTAVVEQEISEVEANDSAAQSIEEDHEFLADVADRIDQANEKDGGLSVESLLYVSIIADHAKRRLGMEEDVIKIPSLESVKLDDRVQISTEQLRSSNEGIGDALSYVWKGMISSTVRAWRMTFAITQIRKKQIEKLRILSTDKRGTNEDRSFEIKTSSFSINGTVGPQFVDQLVKKLSLYERIIDEIQVGSLRALVDFSKEANKIRLDNVDSFAKDLSQLYSKINDPRKKFSNADLTSSFPGGYVLFENEAKKYRGALEAAKKFDDMATQAVPVRLGYMGKDRPATNKQIVKALTPAEVKKICDAALRVTRVTSTGDSLAVAFNSSFSTIVPTPGTLLAGLSLGATGKAFVGGARTGSLVAHSIIGAARNISPAKNTRAVKREYRKELATVKDAHRTLFRLAMWTMHDCTTVFNTNMSGVINYMKKSLR